MPGVVNVLTIALFYIDQNIRPDCSKLVYIPSPIFSWTFPVPYDGRCAVFLFADKRQLGWIGYPPDRMRRPQQKEAISEQDPAASGNWFAVLLGDIVLKVSDVAW